MPPMSAATKSRGALRVRNTWRAVFYCQAMHWSRKWRACDMGIDDSCLRVKCINVCGLL